MAAATLVLAGCSGQVQAERSSGGFVQGKYGLTVVPVGERVDAPGLSGETLSGEQVSLDDFAGQTVLINVWGSWCVPCREEVDDLVAARRRLPTASVAFLGINIRDNRAAALAFEEQYGVTWPSLYDPSSSQLLGFRNSLAAAAVPTTYIIDADGRVAVRMLDKQTAETFIDVVTDVQEGVDG
ncbi:MAG: TlpA family protein disulfide reductase [Nocardioidaceae bacterium]|nr:TlpA family protein disulfide reductase [Nocardioidaceae bacterium]